MRLVIEYLGIAGLFCSGFIFNRNPLAGFIVLAAGGAANYAIMVYRLNSVIDHQQASIRKLSNIVDETTRIGHLQNEMLRKLYPEEPVVDDERLS